MIRSKGEAGTGNIVEAVRHLRSIIGDIRKIGLADEPELFDWAKRLQAPLPLVQEIAETGWLPVPLFCAGGVATPADAALVMQLGAEAVFVGSGIFKSDDPARRAKAIVEATTHFRDPQILAKVSRGLGARDAGRGDRHARRQARRPGLVSADAGGEAARCRGRSMGTARTSACSRCRAPSRRTPASSLSSAPTPSRSAPPPTWRASRRWSCRAASRPRCPCCSSRHGCSTRSRSASTTGCRCSAPAPA